jgi:hypothetical protein
MNKNLEKATSFLNNPIFSSTQQIHFQSNVKLVAGASMSHAPFKSVTVRNRKSPHSNAHPHPSGTPPDKLGPYYIPCNWAYLIFESYTRETRETVYFVIEAVPSNTNLTHAELAHREACNRPTRNHAARHFYRPVTERPIDEDVDKRYSPDRYLDMV